MNGSESPVDGYNDNTPGDDKVSEFVDYIQDVIQNTDHQETSVLP